MVVFQEWFAVNKESTTACVKQQANSESSERATDKNEIIIPVQSIYEVPRKKSMIKFVEEVKDGTAKFMKESKIFDAKMSEIERMIENFDTVDFFLESTESVKSFNKNEIEVACSESILSFKDSKEVHQGKIEKPARIALVQKKSHFTMSSTAPKKLLPKSLSLNNLPTSMNLMPKLSSFQKVLTKKPLISIPSPAVQRILQVAKNKRKKSQTEIPIPVINLKFL